MHNLLNRNLAILTFFISSIALLIALGSDPISMVSIAVLFPPAKRKAASYSCDSSENVISSITAVYYQKYKHETVNLTSLALAIP
jgi:hypothetical protein